MKLYAVLVGGPTLAGYVACCSNEHHANIIARDINTTNMYSGDLDPTTNLSKAWLQGDGRATVIDFHDPEKSGIADFFTWD